MVKETHTTRLANIDTGWLRLNGFDLTENGTYIKNQFLSMLLGKEQLDGFLKVVYYIDTKCMSLRLNDNLYTKFDNIGTSLEMQDAINDWLEECMTKHFTYTMLEDDKLFFFG
jgi:hypothetical protein